MTDDHERRMQLGAAMVDELGKERVLIAARVIMQDRGLVGPGQMKANDVADWIGTLNVEELIELRQIARENVVRKRNGTYTVVMPGPGAKPWQNKLAKFIASWF